MSQNLDRQPLDDLLRAPTSEAAGRRLLQWVRDLYGRIQQGDMTIGILSPDEARRAPEALARAIASGVIDGWLALASWLTTPAIGEPDYIGAEAAIRAGIEAGVPRSASEACRAKMVLPAYRGFPREACRGRPAAARRPQCKQSRLTSHSPAWTSDMPGVRCNCQRTGGLSAATSRCSARSLCRSV